MKITHPFPINRETGCVTCLSGVALAQTGVLFHMKHTCPENKSGHKGVENIIVSIPKLGLWNESLYFFSLCLCAFVAKGFSYEN